jgi:hypothetical protein
MTIRAIVAAISNQVVTRLDAAGFPPLAEGRILLGRQAQFQQHAPPRIIMTPTNSDFSGAEAYSRQPMVSGSMSAEGRAQHAQRSILTDHIRFEVACWGASVDEDPAVQRDDDYDVTQALYHAVLQAVACPPLDDPQGAAVAGPFTSGGVEADGGRWVDATFAAGQVNVLGRTFVFNLTLATPVLDRLFAYAPSDVKAAPKTFLTAADGSTDQGCGDSP